MAFYKYQFWKLFWNCVEWMRLNSFFSQAEEAGEGCGNP